MIRCIAQEVTGKDLHWASKQVKKDEITHCRSGDMVSRCGKISGSSVPLVRCSATMQVIRYSA